MKIFTIARRYLGNYWGVALLASLAMIFQVAMGLLSPWPLKIIFDSVLGTHPVGQPIAGWLLRLVGVSSQTRLGLLGLMIAAMLLIALSNALWRFVGSLLTASIGQRIIYRLRLQVYDHLQRLSISFHTRSRVGDLVARLTSDIQALQDLVTSGLNTLITNSLTVVGIIIIVAWIDWRFAALMLCATPLLLFVSGSYRSRIRQASRMWRRFEGEVGATAQEKLNAIQVVQGFTQEDDESRQFAAQTRQSLNAGLTVSRLQAELTPLVDLVGVMSVAAITWLGAREVIFGRITPGYLLLFITYFRATLSPVRQLAKLSSQFSKAEASAERIEEVLNIESDVADQPNARPLPGRPRPAGAVTLEHVSFAYHAKSPVLRDVDVRIEPGMTVALVGPTGGGKSTLMSLLPRFRDPQEGRVLVDGHDVRELTLRSLRDQISVVFQEPVLFTSSIRDNIAYGRPDASDLDILRAAKAANAHEFIMRQPQGYATILGERGADLSGGQRQRIAIARALVRDAPILLLDEPTTGLDAETEAQVLEALDKLMQGRTTLVIAHRLSTIEHADLILVLQDGRIQERGRHDDLMRLGGVYARWRALQSSEPIALATSLSQRHGWSDSAARAALPATQHSGAAAETTSISSSYWQEYSASPASQEELTLSFEADSAR